MNWQPIETAPKDGAVILGWRFYPVAMRWRPDLDEHFPWQSVCIGADYRPFAENGFMANDTQLTHWMPLPEPPQS